MKAADLVDGLELKVNEFSGAFTVFRYESSNFGYPVQIIHPLFHSYRYDNGRISNTDLKGKAFLFIKKVTSKGITVHSMTGWLTTKAFIPFSSIEIFQRDEHSPNEN